MASHQFAMWQHTRDLTLWGLNDTRHLAIETIISGCYGDEAGGSDFGWEGPVCFSVIFEIFQPGGRTRKVGEIQMATPLRLNSSSASWFWTGVGLSASVRNFFSLPHLMLFSAYLNPTSFAGDASALLWFDNDSK